MRLPHYLRDFGIPYVMSVLSAIYYALPFIVLSVVIYFILKLKKITYRIICFVILAMIPIVLITGFIINNKNLHARERERIFANVFVVETRNTDFRTGSMVEIDTEVVEHGYWSALTEGESFSLRAWDSVIFNCPDNPSPPFETELIFTINEIDNYGITVSIGKFVSHTAIDERYSYEKWIEITETIKFGEEFEIKLPNPTREDKIIDSLTTKVSWLLIFENETISW